MTTFADSINLTPAFYYCLANLFAILVFASLMFVNKKRQNGRKKNAYFRLLAAALIVCAQDILWTLVHHDTAKNDTPFFLFCNVLMVISLTYLAISWYLYFITFSNPSRYGLAKKWCLGLGLGADAIFTIFLFAFHDFWIVGGEVNELLYVILCGIVFLFLGAMIVQAFIAAFRRKNYFFRREYLLNAICPIVLILFTLLQVLISEDLPLFAYGLIAAMSSLLGVTLLFEAKTDALTGLSNRSFLQDYVHLPFVLGHSNNALILLDADNFKLINDAYGHAQGDTCLYNIAEALRDYVSAINEKSLICRYGGDEFIIIVPGADKASLANFETDLNSLLSAKEYPVPLTISSGIANWNGDEAEYDLAFSDADHKMYQSKNAKKNANN